jgi:hypothetical protein
VCWRDATVWMGHVLEVRIVSFLRYSCFHPVIIIYTTFITMDLNRLNVTVCVGCAARMVVLPYAPHIL